MENIRKFLRWTRRILEYKKEWDRGQHHYPIIETRTSNVLLGIFNIIYLKLFCTVETAEDLADIRLPTLDTTIWIEDNKIMYFF